jgi:hypothetical protein
MEPSSLQSGSAQIASVKSGKRLPPFKKSGRRQASTCLVCTGLPGRLPFNTRGDSIRGDSIRGDSKRDDSDDNRNRARARLRQRQQLWSPWGSKRVVP